MISKLLVVAGTGSYSRLVAMLLLGAMAAWAEVPSVTTNDFGNLSSGELRQALRQNGYRDLRKGDETVCCSGLFHRQRFGRFR